MPIALSSLPTARRTRGADVALTWRGVRPHTPIDVRTPRERARRLGWRAVAPAPKRRSQRRGYGHEGQS